MKKAIILFLFVLSISTIQAQTQLETQVNQLEQKVDSLEHELSYLKLSSSLKSLSIELNLFSNELSLKSVDIKSDLYDGITNSTLGKMYKDYYSSAKARMDSFNEAIEANGTYLVANMTTHEYTQIEQKTLFSEYKVIETAYDTVQRAMDLLKATIDAYTKSR